MIRLLAVSCEWVDLFHQALSNACDGRAQDPDGCADDVKEGGNDGLKHRGKDDGRVDGGLVPVTALVEELATRAVHPW